MKSANITRRFPAGWIIIILLFALLFATNPSEGQFTNYLKDRIKEQIEDDETLSGSLQRMIVGSAASIVSAGAERKDYFLFSTYKIRVLDDESLFLGILDHFFKID